MGDEKFIFDANQFIQRISSATIILEGHKIKLKNALKTYLTYKEEEMRERQADWSKRLIDGPWKNYKFERKVIDIKRIEVTWIEERIRMVCPICRNIVIVDDGPGRQYLDIERAKSHFKETHP